MRPRDDIGRFWSKVDKTAHAPPHCADLGNCWVWTAATNKCGYGLFKVSKKVWLAHRYAWSTVASGLEESTQVLHRCDNPPCVNPAHLFLGDPAVNCADKIARGRLGRRDGVYNGRAVLTHQSVDSIRELYRAGSSQKELAQRFGVSQVQISHVVTRKAWR